jgi:peptidoglycan/LPS O-acetylase OafA/YrhL
MEEHCYALLLALAVFQASRRARVVPIAVAGLFAASWLARWTYVVWGYAGAGPIGFTYTHHRIDAVLAGTLAAWLVRSRTLGGREKVALALVAVACFLPTLSLEPYEHRVLFLVGVIPLQAIGFGCLLVAFGASSVPTRRVAWPVRLLAFVGISSYSTYLWHLPFADFLARLVPNAPPMTAFLASALGMGALMFWLIERPAQAWRRRWQAAHESKRIQRSSLAVELA